MNYSFAVEHAQQYGVDEAIMIHNFQFWITQNLANNRHQHDGRTWTYNSQEAFTKLFPFWSRRQIERILKSLGKQEILITGNYNNLNYDRTTWYAFKDEEKWLGIIKKPAAGQVESPLHQTVQPIPPNGAMDSTKRCNLYQIENTDQKPDNNNIVDDDNFEMIFSTEEQPAAKKFLSKIPTQKQVEVLAVLLVMIKTSTISNKVGYLRAIVKSVNDGTFTPIPEKLKPISIQERIDKEEMKRKEEAKRLKVDNNAYFAEIEAKYGYVAGKVNKRD